MIEKMQFVSITGPKADIDRVVDHNVFLQQCRQLHLST